MKISNKRAIGEILRLSSISNFKSNFKNMIDYVHDEISFLYKLLLVDRQV